VASEVERFLDELDHPLIGTMRKVRDAVLEVDPRITEAIKWKSPTFVFHGNLASIDPRSKKHVSLMFHQGAKLPGEHPALQGGGGTVRYLRFVDDADLRAKRKDLEAAVRAWIDLKGG
jgi:hypothetical protein